MSLSQYAKQNGVKYFLISFVDLFGVMRAKLVPATAIDEIAKAGAGFAGFSVWLGMTPAHPDMLLKPDPDTAMQLPWKPEVAWVTGDLVMDGKNVEQSPRQVLKRMVAEAARDGYDMKTGVECEYFLISRDGQQISDEADFQSRPCYDQQALMRRYEVISEICDAMITLGWAPYQNDHEDANGQFEMNWNYDTCLKTADRHTFFKFMTKSIAEKHGLRATFMPKPFANLTGNGCHAHISLWNAAGTNVFADDRGELGLSATA
jgi:glutamine synthetase